MHTTQATALALLASAATTCAWLTTRTCKDHTETDTFYISPISVPNTPAYVVPGVTTYPSETSAPTTLETRVVSASAVDVGAEDLVAAIAAEREAKDGKGVDFKQISVEDQEAAVARTLKMLEKSQEALEDKYADMSPGAQSLRNKLLGHREHTSEGPVVEEPAVESHKPTVGDILAKIVEMAKSKVPSDKEEKPAFYLHEELLE